jgi:ribosomal-protein-alanine N-acetyltransferase
MKHLGTLRRETERLVLRQFVLSDAKAMFDNWASDDEVTKFLTWPTHSSIDVSEEVVKKWVENYADNKFYQWAIALKNNEEEPIGTISVVHMDEDTEMVNIGYCIGKNWWHQGITTEAFNGIIPFLIEQVEVKRIESRHDPRNPNSGKVMLKCGLEFEGLLRSADRNNKGLCDAAMYSLLAKDYLNI